jgi:hypothetical protein
MFYEDVQVEKGETVSGLAVAYGYKPADWRKIWDDGRNKALVAKRKVPEQLQIGDVLLVPIPWVIVKKKVTTHPNGAVCEVDRNGELGTRLTFVQTVYQDNQPVAGTTPFCVDGCPADDNLPFYYTDVEITASPNRRKEFRDRSSRGAPTAAQGTTRWRAIVSLAVVTKKRVTVYNSLVWGWNMTPAGAVTKVGPRDATALEVNGHLNLLRLGKGTGPLTFGKAGWTFRTPPAQ